MPPGPVAYEPSGPARVVRSARPSTSPSPRGGPTDRTLRDLAARLRELQPVPRAPARAGAALSHSTKPREPAREAADAADCKAARRDGEGRRVGSLPLISHSAGDSLPPLRGGPVASTSTGFAPSLSSGGPQPSLRGGPTVSDVGFAPSLSPGVHAREARALTSGRTEVGKGEPPLLGLGPTLAHPSLPDRDPGISWPEVICRSPIRRNEILGICYCPVEPHGTSRDFLYWSRSRKAYVGV